MESTKTHTILIKGDHSSMKYDKLIARTYVDISYGYGKIIFRGTDKKRDELEDHLVDNEGKLGFKLI